MRHGHGLRKLNRTSSHRLAMLRNMMNSLIAHEAIKTTVPKAKELRRVVEPMITLAKEATVANRRLAFDRLRDRDSVSKLFDVLGPRFKARPGGYTRILKMGFRVGDNEFMDLDAAREFARGTGETVKPIRETVKKKLSESSKSILAESCQGLTRPQRLIVEGIYNDFKPLLMLEAELTADQIDLNF